MKYLLMLVLWTTASTACAEWFENIRFDDDPTPKVFRARDLEVIIQASPEDEYDETITATVHHRFDEEDDPNTFTLKSWPTS